jgi:D-serine dehydratase
MKKITIYTYILLFLLLGAPAFAGQIMYTSGSGFFAISEQNLVRATRYSNHERWEKLESLVNLGLIRIFPQGRAVRMDTYRKGIYRVHFLNSRTIWWTTGQGLMNRRGESYVR